MRKGTAVHLVGPMAVLESSGRDSFELCTGRGLYQGWQAGQGTGAVDQFFSQPVRMTHRPPSLVALGMVSSLALFLCCNPGSSWFLGRAKEGTLAMQERCKEASRLVGTQGKAPCPWEAECSTGILFQVQAESWSTASHAIPLRQLLPFALEY